MNMQHLITHAKKRIEEFPELKDEIDGIVDLAQSEIYEGGSPTHEIQLAYTDIEQLVGNE
jgi:hypothetical protein